MKPDQWVRLNRRSWPGVLTVRLHRWRIYYRLAYGAQNRMALVRRWRSSVLSPDRRNLFIDPYAALVDAIEANTLLPKGAPLLLADGVSFPWPLQPHIAQSYAARMLVDDLGLTDESDREAVKHIYRSCDFTKAQDHDLLTNVIDAAVAAHAARVVRSA